MQPRRHPAADMLPPCRGFIGAVGFTPLDFILPQFLWIAAYNPKGPK